MKFLFPLTQDLNASNIIQLLYLLNFNKKIQTSIYLLVILTEASNTPLSPATDSSLTAADTHLVFPPDKLLHTPELVSLIGLNGGLDPRSRLSGYCTRLIFATF
jgi:hypothetical protein